MEDGIVTFDNQLNIIEMNRAARVICGLARQPKPRTRWPNFAERCGGSTCRQVLEQTLRTSQTVREEMAECRFNGEKKKLVALTGSPLLNRHNEFTGVLLIVRDITKIVTLEKELKGRYEYQNIVGTSRKMQEIFELLENLGEIDTTILITGETGTGKGIIATALHHNSSRAPRPFVTVNCSALSESLLESELFGHVKGSFTGATKDRIGRLEAAEGGTVLFDEIGDVPHLIQVKLLRLLQEKEYERVGESRVRKTNVRIIAATNSNLKEEIKKGRFREDLYYRLKVMEIHVPPLRERTEDIPLLVEYFRRFYNKRFNKRIMGISREVLTHFMHYSWPGNVRELKNNMERAFILCNGDVIQLEHVQRDIVQEQDKGFSAKPESILKTAPNLTAELTRTNWNISETARNLGISRWTVYRGMKKLNLSRPG